MKNGPYELIIAPKKFPGKRYRDKYAYEHVVIFWKYHGFVPKTGFEIHHKDMNHRNNKITNLKLLTIAEHRKLHGLLKTQRSMVTVECGFCIKKITIIKSDLEKRLKQNKFKKLFCSTSCGAKHQHGMKAAVLGSSPS